jgi:hypothetical protein
MAVNKNIGCSSGREVNLVAESYQGSRFVGLDVAATGLAAGAADTKGALESALRAARVVDAGVGDHADEPRDWQDAGAHLIVGGGVEQSG